MRRASPLACYIQPGWLASQLAGWPSCQSGWLDMYANISMHGEMEGLGARSWTAPAGKPEAATGTAFVGLRRGFPATLPTFRFARSRIRLPGGQKISFGLCREFLVIVSVLDMFF